MQLQPAVAAIDRDAFVEVIDGLALHLDQGVVAGFEGEAVGGLAGDTVADCRIAFGGLAHVPWRAERAEAALRGATAGEDAFRAAADAELATAEPLRDNAFKVPLARNVLVATLAEVCS